MATDYQKTKKQKPKRFKVRISLYTYYEWIGEAEDEDDTLENARNSDADRQISQNVQEMDRSVEPYEKQNKNPRTPIRKKS